MTNKPYWKNPLICQRCKKPIPVQEITLRKTKKYCKKCSDLNHKDYLKNIKDEN